MWGLLGGFVWLYVKDKIELVESSIWWWNYCDMVRYEKLL